MSKILKPIGYSLITAVMCLGLWSLYASTIQQRAAEAAQAAQVAHCDRANALMLAEFDAIVGAGKFPTQAQQERWVHLTQGCKEAR